MRSGAAAAAFISTVWVVLALREPTVTYHLAPGAVVLSWTAALAWSGRAVSRGARISATAGSAALATAVALGLEARHALEGPTVVGRGPALVEVVIVIALATLAGWVWLRRVPPADSLGSVSTQTVRAEEPGSPGSP